VKSLHVSLDVLLTGLRVAIVVAASIPLSRSGIKEKRRVGGVAI